MYKTDEEIWLMAEPEGRGPQYIIHCMKCLKMRNDCHCLAPIWEAMTHPRIHMTIGDHETDKAYD